MSLAIYPTLKFQQTFLGLRLVAFRVPRGVETGDKAEDDQPRDM